MKDEHCHRVKGRAACSSHAKMRGNAEMLFQTSEVEELKLLTHQVWLRYIMYNVVERSLTIFPDRI